MEIFQLLLINNGLSLQRQINIHNRIRSIYFRLYLKKIEKKVNKMHSNPYIAKFNQFYILCQKMILNPL